MGRTNIFKLCDISTGVVKSISVSIWRRISRFSAVGMMSMIIICLPDIMIASYCMTCMVLVIGHFVVVVVPISLNPS